MKRMFAVLLVSSVALVACVQTSESVAPSPNPNLGFKARYVPLGGVVPFPNDLFFSGSVDGTLNIPTVNPSDGSDFLVAMNALDGYSTTASIFVPFSAPIDPATVQNSDVVMLDTTAGVPLVPGTNYTVGVSAAAGGNSDLQIKLLKPLPAKHRIMVVVTRTISDMSANVAVPDDDFQTMLNVHAAVAGATLPSRLNAVYGAVSPLLTTAVGLLGIPDAANLVTFSFLTQSTSDELAFVDAHAVAGTSLIAAQVGTNKSLLDPLNGNGAITNSADIFAGFIAVPYYQHRTDVLGGHWHTATGGEVTKFSIAANAGPVATETLNFPILLSVPNGGTTGHSTAIKPGSGWPIVVFQHGITGNRTNMIAIAQAYANAGYAVVAMDHPLHGLPVGHPLRIPTMGPYAITEPTFDADVTNNTTGAPGADGIVDSSGQNYINLSSLLTSRDNLRQTVADLSVIVKTLSNLSYDGVAGGDFDTSRIMFTGHSLGAITGATFLGVNTGVQAATLAMPGGTIAQLLRDSPTFAPRINAGLAANGVVAGTQLYESFMQAAQTVVDSGDPINFATAANANHAIHLIQVVGNGGANLPDQVVPNSATARLIAALGLVQYSGLGAHGTDGFVNFTAGGHSSILDPTASVAATVEMQTETATFMATNGGVIAIGSTAVTN